MYYIYVIQSTIRNYIYVGLTNDVSRRFQEHNRGRAKTTKPYRPFKLILTESFKNRGEARMREKYLKSGSGKEYIKEMIHKI
ncbi:GIY-YIG nuclease family protein [Patescibacteria group bacterium]|nr:GIY-YIG nuclease family protein [Patescibacteria group bacterium]